MTSFHPSTAITFPFGLPRRFQVLLGVMAALSTVVGILDGLSLALIVPLAEILIDTPASAEGNTLIEAAKGFFSLLGVRFTVSWVVAAILSAQIIRVIGLVLQTWLNSYLRAQYEEYLKTSTFKSLIRARWPFFLTRQTGDLVNMLTSQASRGGSVLSSYAEIVASVMTAIIYFTGSLLLSWQLSLAAAGYTVLIVIVMSFLLRITRRLGEQITDAGRRQTTLATETLSGLKAIKSSGIEHVAEAGFAREARRFSATDADIGLNQGILLSASELMFVAALVGGIVLAAQVIGVPAAALLLFALLFFRIFQRAKTFQASLQSVVQGLPGHNAIKGVEWEAAQAAEETSGATATRMTAGVIISNVTFSYESSSKILDGVTLEIPAGSMIGLVGPSGVGKTTVMDLAIGLLKPTSGNVLVDGVSLNELNQNSWRKRLAYVPQGAILFNDTIAGNIALGLDGVSDSDIQKAARLADAHEFIQQLPEGYATVTGERGVRLSGGQRQRIAIARALLRRPDLLILDEATSELDAGSEKRVQENLESLKGQMAMMVVAHRLSTVLNVDRLYVLEGGKVVEHGPPADLLAQQGRFHRMYVQALSRDDTSESRQDAG